MTSDEEEVVNSFESLLRLTLVTLHHVAMRVVESLNMSEYSKIDSFTRVSKLILRSVVGQKRMFEKAGLETDQICGFKKNNGETTHIRFDERSLNLLFLNRLGKVDCDRLYAIMTYLYETWVQNDYEAIYSRFHSKDEEAKQGIRGLCIRTLRIIRKTNKKVFEEKSVKENGIEGARMRVKIKMLKSMLPKGSNAKELLDKYKEKISRNEDLLCYYKLTMIINGPKKRGFVPVISPTVLYSKKVVESISNGEPFLGIHSCKMFNIAMEEFYGRTFLNGNKSARMEAIAMLRLCNEPDEVIAKTIGRPFQTRDVVTIEGAKFASDGCDYDPKRLGKVSILNYPTGIESNFFQNYDFETV